MTWLNQVHFGDCLETLRRMPDSIANTCVTSPPYFGLRDYGHSGQIGLEASPEEFVQRLVDVFREVRRVLRDDGTCWVNMGDSYGRGKQLLMVPARLAIALQADGWVLRQDIIWHKPNPMPESSGAEDRCCKAHEYIFLLAKSKQYYFDFGAIKEEADAASGERYAYAFGGGKAARMTREEADGPGNRTRPIGYREFDGMRRKRSVWTVSTKHYSGAHFATFPEDLIEPCILAGAPAGGVVLDPFMGSGTTAAVATRLGRQWIGCELNPAYEVLQQERLSGQTLGLQLA